MTVLAVETKTTGTKRPGTTNGPGQGYGSDGLREGLVLLCRQLGRTVSVAELGDGMPLTNGRLSADHVPRALRRAGVSARVEPVPLGVFADRLLPALLLLKDGGTLVLVERQPDQAVVLVPESGGGEARMSWDQLAAQYSGMTVLAKPNYQADGRAEDFARQPQEHWFWGPLKQCWPAYAEVGATSLFANLLAVSISLFALQVYDRVVPNSALETLWVLATGVIVAIFLEFLLRFIRSHLLDVVGKRLDVQLSSKLFSQVLQMRLSARPQSTGAFSNKVREFESVREFFTSATAGVISDVPFVFLFLALIFYIGGPVVFVPMLAIGLMLIPSLLWQGRLARLSRANMREGAIRNGLLHEVLENLETVKVTSAEGRNQRIWEELSTHLSEGDIRVRRVSAWLSQSAATVQQLCHVGVVVVGVYLVSLGQLTVGGIIACSILATRAVAPINQVTGILVRWQHVKVALEGLESLMSAPVERPQGRTFIRKPRIQGNYVLQDLEFRYHPESAPALKIPLFELKAGERVILLGGNGSGKSTLLRLMSGLSDPTAGHVMLDGVYLGQIDPADRRRDIGFLPQDVALFYGTLRDNLVLDGRPYGDDELLDVLDAVGLGKAVRMHPLGLDMPITGSNSVSGGQRQAIGLARLMLQDPAIVLMDEPTAAFDQASEQHVIQHLHRWLEGRTLVVSTHKRALLALGQRGVVLQDGRLTMDGPLAELVSGQQGRGKSYV